MRKPIESVALAEPLKLAEVAQDGTLPARVARSDGAAPTGRVMERSALHAATPRTAARIRNGDRYRISTLSYTPPDSNPPQRRPVRNSKAHPEEPPQIGTIALLLLEAARRLIGRPELVHGVVVRVGDMGAALRVQVLADEVEQVAVGARGDAGDAQVADVPHVHRGGRDLADRPGGATGTRGQVQRLGAVQVPAADWRGGCRGAVGRSRPRAAPPGCLPQRVGRGGGRGAEGGHVGLPPGACGHGPG